MGSNHRFRAFVVLAAVMSAAACGETGKSSPHSPPPVASSAQALASGQAGDVGVALTVEETQARAAIAQETVEQLSPEMRSAYREARRLTLNQSLQTMRALLAQTEATDTRRRPAAEREAHTQKLGRMRMRIAESERELAALTSTTQ